MEYQFVTLAINKNVLAQAEQLAANRQISLSDLMARLIEDEAVREQSYRLAATRQAALMERGLNLGTNGVPDWTRDDLHSR